jgi:glycosyltransferase involved in cell wall biosynthesis
MVAACPFPYPRGTPIRILRMAEALVERGHEVHVVTYHLGEAGGPLPFPVHRIRNVPSYRRLSPGPTYQKLLVVDGLLAAKLREVLARHEIDLVHAHHYEGLAAAWLGRGRQRQPLIYDAHTLLSSELRFYKLGLPRRLKDAIGRFLDGRLPRRAAHVIAATEAIRGRLIRQCHLAPDDVTVVPSGIEGALFDVTPEEPIAFRPGTKTLVFSGNLAPYQGIELLLRAFREVLARRADVRLLLLTGTPFGPHERLAAALGVRGQIDVVNAAFAAQPRYLAGADVALNPRTQCDGIPQKLLNYMAAGKPIVSFRSSAEVLHPGVTGWVVEDGDVPGFAEAILRLLADQELARRLGTAARDWVLGHYTWARTAERTEEVYERVLGRAMGARAAANDGSARRVG